MVDNDFQGSAKRHEDRFYDKTNGAQEYHKKDDYTGDYTIDFTLVN